MSEQQLEQLLEGFWATHPHEQGWMIVSRVAPDYPIVGQSTAICEIYQHYFLKVERRSICFDDRLRELKLQAQRAAKAYAITSILESEGFKVNRDGSIEPKQKP